MSSQENNRKRLPEVTILESGIGAANRRRRFGPKKQNPGMLGSLDLISRSFDASSDTSKSKKSKSLWEALRVRSKGTKAKKDYKVSIKEFDDIPDEVLRGVSDVAIMYGKKHLSSFVNILNFSTKYRISLEGVKYKREQRWADEDMIEDARAGLVECGAIKEFYKMKSTIGTGAFGKVSKAVDKQTRETVAVKQLTRGDTEKDIHEALMEVAFLKYFDHPNLLSFRKVIMAKNKIFLATEYICGFTVEKLVTMMDFDHNFICILSRNILCGLEHMHQRNFIHMDLKGSNIMISETGNIKIVDFGLSTQLVKSITGIRGSAFWIAPEMILSKKCDSKIDIWAFGIIILTLLLRNVPNKNSKIDAMVAAASGKIHRSFPCDIDEVTNSFLKECLRRNPQHRSSATELLEHEYLQLKPDMEAFQERLITSIMVESVLAT